MTYKYSLHWFIKIALWRHLGKNRRGIFKNLFKNITTRGTHIGILRESPEAPTLKIGNLASMTDLDQTSLRPKHSYCIQPYQFHKDHGLHFTEPISLTSTSSTQTLMNMGKI